MGTAVVAGLFSLIVSALLIFNYFQSRHADALDSKELDALKAALAQDPRNDSIKAEVRTLDLQLRKKYFRHREFSRKGGFLLLGGIVVFLIAIKSAAAYRKKLPMPPHPSPRSPLGRGAGGEGRAAMIARWSVAAFGLVMGGAALALVIISERGSTKEFLATIEGTQTPAMERARTPPSTGGPRGASSVPPLEGGGATPEEIQRNWPRFRGPGGLGISAYTNVPSSWNGQTGEGILWKTPVPLPGESSPIVWGNRVFLTGATEEKRDVYCFDADSGKLLWQSTVENIPGSLSEPPAVTDETGFAASTGVTDGRYVYAIFANGDIICFDFNGKRVWARNLGMLQNTYGHATSLAMYRDTLLVLLDQGSGDDGLSALTALEAHSGKTVWQTPRPVPNSWASPIVINTGGREEIITCGSPWVIAYDPATGAELWRADCLGGDVAPSPIYANGLVFAVNASYYLAAIRPDGQGDVTKTHIVWTAEEGLPDICSPVSNGELVFVLTTYGGILTCYDAQDGSFVWEKKLGTSFRTSPSLVGERLYLMSQSGVMFIVEAGREYKELGSAELGEASNACPAFLDGRIYIRGKEHLYCIGELGG